MKTINTYIIEKLKVPKAKKSKNQQTEYTLFPIDKDELRRMIENEIKQNGNECNLNHIDVSKIDDMSGLFYYSAFDGDISDWDVSNVENMCEMFLKSSFTGKNSDISEWNVSNVKNMVYMFKKSDFNNDISDWDINPKCKTYGMIASCNIKKEYIPVNLNNESDIYNVLPF